MRALVLLLVLLPAAAIAQRYVAPKYSVASGTSVTVADGTYLVEAVGERTCICAGTTSCSESTGQGQASGPVATCIPDGAALIMRLQGTDATLAVWSDAGTGRAVLTRQVP